MDQEGARNPKGAPPVRSRKILQGMFQVPAKALGSPIAQQMMLIPVEGQFLSGLKDPLSDQGTLLQQPPQDKEGPPGLMRPAERQNTLETIQQTAVVFLPVESLKFGERIIDMIPVFDVEGEEVHEGGYSTSPIRRESSSTLS